MATTRKADEPADSRLSSAAVANRRQGAASTRPVIQFITKRQDPFIAHVLSWLEDLLCVSFEAVDRPTGPDSPVVVYGEPIEHAQCIHIPYQLYANMPAPLLEDYCSRPIGRTPVQFSWDLFEAVRFWMTDQPHADLPASMLDEHERLPQKKAVFTQLGIDAVPIVNRYIIRFRDALEAIHGRALPPLWPDGKKACVILSHDVDDPLDPGTFRTALQTARLLTKIWPLDQVRRFLQEAISRALRASFHRGQKKKRHWLFREIMAAEAELGFRSTFFFATRDRYAIGASREYDVIYATHEKRFSHTFAELRRQGFEIGLHASYNAHQDADMLASEKNTLETHSGGEVFGNRHHYWHVGAPFWPTLQNHAAAGLRYDSSIAFNDTPGFRQGIGLPFHPWDPTNGVPITTLQIPPVIMDGAIFYQPTPLDEGLQIINALLDSLVAHEAVGAVDWHVRTSFPANNAFGVWGECYLELLAELARRPDIWVTSCEGLLRHWEARTSE